MDTRIVVVGAGSAMFSLSLVRDFCLTPALADSRIVFVDVDAGRLEAVHALCVRYAAEVGTRLRLEQTTDRRAALAGADFVINTALVAGHRRLREGWDVARRHGYRFGGSLHVMHDEAFWINFQQLRLFDALTRDVLEICPQAWCLLVANPVLAGVTWLGRSYAELRLVGLCHGFSGVFHLAEELGLAREGLDFEIPGVNHFVWLTRLTHEGRDVLPRVDEWIAKEAPAFWQRCGPSDGLGPAPVDLYRRFGRFPIGDTATPGGGSWPPWYHWDEATERAWHEDPEAWWRDVYFGEADRTVARIRALADDPRAHVTQAIPLEKSGEVIVDLVEAIACDTPRTLIGNVLNAQDFVPGVPRNFAVEIPLSADGAGVRGNATTPLPAGILARLWRDRLAPVELELAAYAQGSRELLRQLILTDPFTRSLAQADALLEDILALPGHEAMRAHYR